MRGSRTCRGGPSVPFTDAPPGFRPSVRPSSLPPPPARLPSPRISNRECHSNLKNSNRESLELEINATQTKQTPEPHSNRELEALFFGPSRGGSFLSDPPAFRPRPRRRVPPPEIQSQQVSSLKNSNRE